MIELVGDRVDIVERTIADVHRRFGEFVSLDDLRSEAHLWWYGPGQPYLQEYLTEDENHVRLRRSVWRWCARYAEQEKAQQSGYNPGDQLDYSPTVVVGILPIALDPDGVPGAGLHEGPAPKGNLAEGGTVLAILMDVRRALDHVPEEDLQFLSVVTDFQGDWDRVATYTQTLPDSCRRRHARIIQRMCRWLNGSKIEEKQAA